jgi:hypothetical protein
MQAKQICKQSILNRKQKMIWMKPKFLVQRTKDKEISKRLDKIGKRI